MNPTLSGHIDHISPPPIVKHVLASQNAKKLAREKINRDMKSVRPPPPFIKKIRMAPLIKDNHFGSRQIVH